MLRRDYIQRMIEEFGKMLGHVMGLKAMNQNQKALNELRAGYKTYFELDSDFLRSIPVDEFLGQLLKTADFKNQHLEMLATALETEAGLLNDVNSTLVFDLRKKALILFLYLENIDSTTFSVTRKEAISELQEILDLK